MAKGEPKLTAEELAAPITAANFWRRVAHFVRHVIGAPDELPTIRPGTSDWHAWQEYFERHLQWVPTIMSEVLNERFEVMTVPTPRPEQFDLAFVEDPEYRLRHPWFRIERRRLEALRAAQPDDHTQQAIRDARTKPYQTANVFVAPDHPIYPQMVERYDRGAGGKVGELRGVAGLWVPLVWMPERRGNRLAQMAAAITAGAALAAKREAVLHPEDSDAR